ncbi:MAG: GNAT family N-acetyltransferase [Nocardioidaceae bacterium]|nr:GNAT family N-acetyltransferase [Nocardioidaceae bacterium]
MNIMVRAPRLSDVEQLAVVNIETWQHAYTGLVVQERLDAMDIEEYSDRWRSNLTDPPEGRIFLVAEEDTEVVAYAIGGPYRPQDEDDETPETARMGEVYALYAHPRSQGTGAGKAVHDALLERLADAGYDEAALWVLRDNDKTRAWYRRQGWREDGGTSNWVAHDVPHPEVRLRRRTSDDADEPTGLGDRARGPLR